MLVSYICLHIFLSVGLVFSLFAMVLSYNKIPFAVALRKTYFAAVVMALPSFALAVWGLFDG